MLIYVYRYTYMPRYVYTLVCRNACTDNIMQCSARARTQLGSSTPSAEVCSWVLGVDLPLGGASVSSPRVANTIGWIWHIVVYIFLNSLAFRVSISLLER